MGSYVNRLAPPGDMLFSIAAVRYPLTESGIYREDSVTPIAIITTGVRVSQTGETAKSAIDASSFPCKFLFG